MPPQLIPSIPRAFRATVKRRAATEPGEALSGAIELAERLKEMAPMEASKIFFTSSGSEANDTQVKLVWYMNNALGRPEKKKIISRMKAYHGVTVMAASLTGLPAKAVARGKS